MNERYDFVIRAAHEIERRYIGAVPFDVALLCRRLGVETMPMSYFLERGGTQEGFFALIGNEDGAALSDGVSAKILYNDAKPRRRVKFTLAEELMHIILRHVDDPRFALASTMDAAIYAQYENEAKNGAGLLLMPPVVYFRLRRSYSFAKLASLCDISTESAYMTARFCDEHEDAIRAVYGTRFAPHCSLIRSVAPSRSVQRRGVSVWR